MSKKDERGLHPSNWIAFGPYFYTENESEEKKPVPTHTKGELPTSKPKLHPSNYAFYNEVITQSQIKKEISSSDSFSLT